MVLEVMFNRNTELRRKIQNVGRPEDEKPTSEKSKLAKNGEIVTKVVEDMAVKRLDDQQRDGDQDLDNAKQIMGGVTQVEMNPKTNDKIDNESDENKKGKSAAKQQNKLIGQKGAPAVKEETKVEENNMIKMPNQNPFMKSDTSFGVSSSLVEAAKAIMMEKLKGNQTKIDANHNGKIDGEDFKLLRKKKEMEEAAKAHSNKDIDGEEDSEKEEKAETKKVDKMKMMDKTCPKCGSKSCKCDDMKEEVEQIDELTGMKNSKMKQMAYAMKATKQVAGAHETDLANDKDEMRKFKNRMTGLNTMKNKMAKEEAEQIDEISKKAAMSAYQSATFVDDEHPKADAIRGHIEKKWGKEMGKHADAHAHLSNYPRHNPFQKDDKLKSAKPASKMRTTASGKIHKQDIAAKKTEIKSRMKEEEVEFSAAELAHFEAVMEAAKKKEVDEDDQPGILDRVKGFFGGNKPAAPAPGGANPDRAPGQATGTATDKPAAPAPAAAKPAGSTYDDRSATQKILPNKMGGRSASSDASMQSGQDREANRAKGLSNLPPPPASNRAAEMGSDERSQPKPTNMGAAAQASRGPATPVRKPAPKPAAPGAAPAKPADEPWYKRNAQAAVDLTTRMGDRNDSGR